MANAPKGTGGRRPPRKMRLRKMLPALDDIVTSLAGEVLCGGGGGCGGLA